MSLRVRILALFPVLVATLAGISASAVSNHAEGRSAAPVVVNEAGRTSSPAHR
jgi:hypothetical protein